MGKAGIALVSSSFIAGLFLGISLLTGTSIDPVDLMGIVGQAIIGQLAPQYSTLFGALLLVLTIVGIWQLITLIISGASFGIFGLIMTVVAFFGGLMLVFNPLAGLFFGGIGYVIGLILQENSISQK